MRLSRLGLCIAIACVACEPCDADGGAEPNAVRVSAAVRRAGVYLGGRALYADAAWLSFRGARLLGHDWDGWASRLVVRPDILADAHLDPLGRDDFRGIEATFWKGRTLAGVQWPSLPRPSAMQPRRPSVAMEPQDLERLVPMLRGMLLCDRYDEATTRQWTALLRAPMTSYMATHQLLAVGSAHERGCMQSEAQGLRRTLANQVFAELLGDEERIDDLSVERMAVLAYVGLTSWLDARLIRALVRTQAADGSWGERSRPLPPGATAPGEQPPEHTAALAFYVLASYATLHEETVGPP
jgi:hypothetical protein